MVNAVSKQQGITQADAYRNFVQSKTYELLCLEDAKLYTEGFEYVLDMYECELRGDTEGWMAQ